MWKNYLWSIFTKRAMRSILLFALLFYSGFVSFSQDDDYFEEDSLHLTQFLQQVHHIELCELGLTCYMDSVYVDDSDEMKSVKRCYLAGAIKSREVDFSKIKCRQVATNKEDFFHVFLKSTRNTSRIMGACYQPRNGILFFDKDQKLLAYLEICFECHNINTIKRLGSMDFEEDDFELLENLFTAHEIKTN
jgi:hypothetical protein